MLPPVWETLRAAVFYFGDGGAVALQRKETIEPVGHTSEGKAALGEATQEEVLATGRQSILDLGGAEAEPMEGPKRTQEGGPVRREGGTNKFEGILQNTEDPRHRTGVIGPSERFDRDTVRTDTMAHAKQGLIMLTARGEARQGTKSAKMSSAALL